ncbi:aminodeoxychorismate synthase component I [Arthrobacter pigmenti]
MTIGRSAAPLIIAVDGRSGAGKTTLALELAANLRTHHTVSLFHLEDIYPGWDGLQAGVEAYRQSILGALNRGTTAHWQPWDWNAGRHGAEQVLALSEIVVVEGVGAGSTAARPMVDVVIWCTATDRQRKERALARDGDLFAPFWDRWARQEAALLQHDDVTAAADLLVEVQSEGDVPVQVLYALANLPQAEHLLIPERTSREGLGLHTRRIDADIDPATCFQAFYGQSRRAVWLDSSNASIPPAAGAGGDEHAAQRNRFSIMADDGGRLGQSARHRQGRTSVRSGGVTSRIHGPFFRWLDTVWGHGQLKSGCPSDFALGWLGYLGYELKRETGGSDTNSGSEDAALIFASRGLVFDHAERCIYLLALDDGNASVTAWLDDAADRLRQLAAAPPSSAPSTGHGPMARPPEFTMCNSRRDYLERIGTAQQQITDGNSYEICLTTQLSARPSEPIDPWATYLRLRHRNPAPFASYLRFGDLHIASTSPERFLCLDPEGNIRAEPIKGTRPRDSDPARDTAIRRELESSLKDRAENIMIVDLLRNDLSHFSVPGTVTVARLCAIESYATVHQLVSTVDARLRPGADRASAVAAAFPAGSMTGAPKISTMAILDRLEQSPRGVYSGALGYFSLNGAADLSVVIRTLVISADDSGQQLTLGVGGAITADSEPEAEWEEVRTKAYGVLSALGSRFPD